MSNLHWTTGRHRESYQCVRQAFDLDPLQLEVGYGRVASSFAGHRDDTAELSANFTARWPGEEALMSALLTIPALAGDWAMFDRMIAPVKQRGISSPDIGRYVFYLESLRNPAPALAEATLHRLRQTFAAKGTVSTLEFGFAFVLGRKDEAFDLVEKASFAHLFDLQGAPPSQGGNPGTMFLDYGKIDVAHDIRMMRYCAKLGLCDYWVNSDRWPDCADTVPYDFRAEARRLAAKPAA
jgi:hypothetical protein